jgi:hypothetical protein
VGVERRAGGVLAAGTVFAGSAIPNLDPRFINGQYAQPSIQTATNITGTNFR